VVNLNRLWWCGGIEICEVEGCVWWCDGSTVGEVRLMVFGRSVGGWLEVMGELGYAFVCGVETVAVVVWGRPGLGLWCGGLYCLCVVLVWCGCGGVGMVPFLSSGFCSCWEKDFRGRRGCLI